MLLITLGPVKRFITLVLKGAAGYKYGATFP